MSKYKKRRNLYRKSNILIQNFHPTSKLPISRTSIQALISRVFKSENVKLNALDINMVNNSKIRKINRDFLKHDYFTDIITFPYENDRNKIEGEIFISLDTVRKNSDLYDVSYTQELKRVIIHGALHLVGYNDKTEKEKEAVRKKENFYLGL